MADLRGSAGFAGEANPGRSEGPIGNDLEGDLPAGDLVLRFPHFGFLAHAERTGELVAAVDNVSDPMHHEVSEDNGGGAFPLSFSDVSAEGSIGSATVRHGLVSDGSP